MLGTIRAILWKGRTLDKTFLVNSSKGGCRKGGYKVGGSIGD